mgnify:CR=1 FL=1
MRRKFIILFIIISNICFAEYNRIIIMAPSMFEVACLLEVENKVIGLGELGKNAVYPEEKSKEIKKLGNPFRPSIEKIIGENPDLVIVNDGINFPVEELRKRNIKVVSFSTKRIGDIFNNIKKFGKLVEKEKEAKKIVEQEKKKLAYLKKSEKTGIKGIFIYSTAPLMAFNEKSLPGDILELLGIENIGKDLRGEKPIIGLEYLIKENPDFIVGIMAVKSVEELKKAIPMIEYTNAGKNGNIFLFDAELIYINSPRMIEGIEEFQKKIEKIK